MLLPENTVRGLVIDQTNFNFEGSKLVRNTYPYNVFGDGVAYDYVFQPYLTNNQESLPDNLGIGSVTDITVRASGEGYSVGDSIVFDETNTEGGGLSAEVQKSMEKPLIELQVKLHDLQVHHSRLFVKVLNSESIHIMSLRRMSLSR